MSLDIGDALSRGYRRTVARNGLLLVAITYVLNLINGVFGPPTSAYPSGGMGMSSQPLITVPTALNALLSLIFTVAGILVTIGALRIFVGEETENLPTEVFTRDAFSAFINVFIGAIVFAIVVGIGLVLFVIPGLFLLTSLVFWPVFVAAEGENFIEAFQRSWDLTSGRRLTVFGLGVIFVVIAFVVSLVFGLPAILLGPAAIVVTAIGTAFVAIFGDAVLASAYNQLQAQEAEGEAETTEPGETDEADESGTAAP